MVDGGWGREKVDVGSYDGNKIKDTTKTHFKKEDSLSFPFVKTYQAQF